MLSFKTYLLIRGGKIYSINNSHNVGEFELSDGSYSVSDIQYYIKYLKKYEASPANPPIHICINRIDNRLVFKIKDGYDT